MSKIIALTITIVLLLPPFADSFADDNRQVKVAITVQEASQIVMNQFPSARILEIELENEDSRAIYEVELITAEGQKKEVHVDAVSGAIHKVEHD
jgi:uncharacterized membrane protein YkoI